MSVIFLKGGEKKNCFEKRRSDVEKTKAVSLGQAAVRMKKMPFCSKRKALSSYDLRALERDGYDNEYDNAKDNKSLLDRLYADYGFSADGICRGRTCDSGYSVP